MPTSHESEEKKRKILDYLKIHPHTYIKEIAKGVGMSTGTVSKFLSVLSAEGKVKREDRPPYVYYDLA